MNQQYEQLYQNMLMDIQKCMKVQLPETENVTSCFWVAKNYWEHLKRKILEKPFANDNEEIIFFREIKPMFTSQIQYFATLSEALLFVPVNREDQVSFWQNEMERYNFFRDRHKEFVEYYESGSDNLDKIYFTRMKENVEPLQPLVSYDADKNYCSSHDHLVRCLLAHRLYNENVQNKLKELRTISF